MKETIDFQRGPIMLIRTMLSSLPIYFMSLFTIPRKLSLEKIQRDFLWGAEALKIKLYMVKLVFNFQEK